MVVVVVVVLEQQPPQPTLLRLLVDRLELLVQLAVAVQPASPVLFLLPARMVRLVTHAGVVSAGAGAADPLQLVSLVPMVAQAAFAVAVVVAVASVRVPVPVALVVPVAAAVSTFSAGKGRP